MSTNSNAGVAPLLSDFVNPAEDGLGDGDEFYDVYARIEGDPPPPVE